MDDQEALVRNAADPKQVRAAKKRENYSKRQQREDLQFLLRYPQAKRFIWRLLSKCGVYRQSFTGDANSTFYYEGQRNIGLALLTEVTEADPAAYLAMMTEAARGERLNVHATSGNNATDDDADA